MECGLARELLLDPLNQSSPGLAAHLGTCADCAAQAEAEARLAALLRPALVIAPPPALAESVVRLALSAAPERRPVAPLPSAGGWAPLPSVAGYLVAGLVLGTAVGLLGIGSNAAYGLVLAALLEPLGTLLSWPLGRLIPSPGQLVAAWAPWLGLLILAWALRPGPAAQPEPRAE